VAVQVLPGTPTTKGYMQLVVKEGEAIGDLYAHLFDTLADAIAYRKDCANHGYYRTTVPLKVPQRVAKALRVNPKLEDDLVEFLNVVTEACVFGVEYPEVKHASP